MRGAVGRYLPNARRNDDRGEPDEQAAERRA